MINSESLFQTFNISYVGYFALVIFCVFVTLILPRLKTIVGSVITVVFLSGFTAYYHFRFCFEMVLPVLVLITGYGTLIARQYRISKKQISKETSGDHNADKMMGLFYQQQGMLDLAFEKYRSIPLKGDIKDLIYDLGIAFEKQGEIKKALDAYRLVSGSLRVGKELEETDALFSSDSADIKGEEPEENSVVQKDIPKSRQNDILGEYELIKEIGHGGYGRRHQGRRIKTDTPVVIIVNTFSETATEPFSDLRARFFDVMDSLARMRHENMIAINGYGETRGLYYVAMEDFNGEPLTAYIEKDSLLPVRECLRVVSLTADVLHSAHKNGIIHQLLRPECLIRANDSQDIKVKDFEIYQMFSMSGAKPDFPPNGHLYMSPEEIAGKKVDGRSDIFSLGIILFELLTGAKPFSGEDLTDMMLKISKEKHVSPRFFNPKVPPVVEKIIDRALEKDLEKRYQNSGQMAGHLNKVIKKIDELRDSRKQPSFETHKKE